MPILQDITPGGVGPWFRGNQWGIGFECVASNPDISTEQTFELPVGALIRSVYGNVDFWFQAPGRMLWQLVGESDESIMIVEFVHYGSAESNYHVEFNRPVNTVLNDGEGKIKLTFEFFDTGVQIIEAQGMIDVVA
jgi:hypothetical protein